MSRQSRLWLLAAATVAIVVMGVVVIFGISYPPAFPGLYKDGGPTIQGTVAFVEHGRDQCVNVLDVASGDRREVTCGDWMWVQGWDEEGNLIVPGEPEGRPVAIDPATGEVVQRNSELGPPPPQLPDQLRVRNHDGKAALTFDDGSSSTVLVDVVGPRNYAFWSYGLTADGSWAWVVDSEDRLLVVALDGSSGPWVVAEGVGEVAWK